MKKKIFNYLRKLADTPPVLSWLHIKGKLFQRRSYNQFDEQHPCIFVLSTGRVGSKTLSALLALNSDILSFHEPKPALYRLSKMSYENNNIECNKVLEAAFLSLRTDLLQFAINQGKGYIETSPQATFLAPVIYTLIPNVKFIHLVRNPIDVVRSGMSRNWYAGNSADETRIEPGESDVFLKSWGQWSPLEKNIWLWSETNRWILDFKKTIPDEQLFTIKSEDVFSGENDTLHQLYNFCSLDYPKTKKIHKVLNKKLNSQHNNKFQPFPEWSIHEHNELKLLANDISSILGYSLDI